MVRNKTQEPRFGCTKDYSLFVVHEKNREEVPLKELEAMMRKHGFLPGCAIHVQDTDGGKFLIIRGHHRYVTAKKLGLPVWFIVDNTPVDINDLEQSYHQAWSIRDHAVSRARAGEPAFMELLEFQKELGIPLGAAASLIGGELAGSMNKVYTIKTGAFKVGDLTNANKVKTILAVAKEVGFAYATQSAFLSAITRAIMIPEFSVQIFCERLKVNPTLIKKMSTQKDYLAEIERLYNHAAKTSRLNVVFRANEVCQSRVIIKKKEKTEPNQETNQIPAPTVSLFEIQNIDTHQSQTA